MNGTSSPKPHNVSKPLDMNDVEMVFGSPGSPRGRVQPDVLIMNERNHGKSVHKNAESDTETAPSQPLLEPDKVHPMPPFAGPEVDDLDDEIRAVTTVTHGLLKPNNNKPAPEGNSDGFNGIESIVIAGDSPGSTFPGSVPDANTYQQKKNLAQGMMDLALLSANANQLRYVLETSITHPYYYPSLVFITLSVFLQIAVGIGLIINSRYDVNDQKHMYIANKINNMIVLGIFLITIVNVFITSFSVATPATIASQHLAMLRAG